MKVGLLALPVGWACASLGNPCGDAWADAARRVRVRGTAHVEAHVARGGGRLVVSGGVVDDALRPLVGVRVDVTFALTADPAAPVAWLTPPEGCTRAGALSGAGSPPLVLTTDAAGRFCARVALPLERYSARITAHGTDLVEGAALEIPVDLARASLIMRFTPERPLFTLDDETASLQVAAASEDEGVVAPAAGLLLSVSGDAGAVLSRATTDASGNAEFVMETSRLGPPGEGELRIAFGGNATVGAAERTLHVQRRAGVSLSILDVHDGRLRAAWPEDGFSVRVMAVTAGKNRGWAPTGTVEAYLGGTMVVGAAPLKDGAANVPVAFAVSEASPTGAEEVEVPLTFRYVADSPWLRATGDASAIQPVRPPSAWRRAPLALAAIVVVAWLVVARMPPRRKAPPSPHARKETGAVVHVQAFAARAGWTGHVSDAHDGYAVPNVRVSIERPGFDRADVVAETTCDGDGDFVLEDAAVVPGDRLVLSAALHAPLRCPVPSPGQLAITLVLRKRALLDRLASWARRRPGASTGREPTPGEVRTAAEADEPVARWAQAVEQAAYSGAIVDERIQAEVDRLAPRGADDVDDARPRSL